MLKRNLAVKMAPQRWQENAADGFFDVVLTFEEKVFDMVVQGLCVYIVLEFNFISYANYSFFRKFDVKVVNERFSFPFGCSNSSGKISSIVF